MMFLVLDIQGSEPKVSDASQYNKDVDNYEGDLEADTGEKLTTPKADPGMPILPFSYKQYFNLYSDNLVDSASFHKDAFHSPRITVSQNNYIMFLIT